FLYRYVLGVDRRAPLLVFLNERAPLLLVLLRGNHRLEGSLAAVVGERERHRALLLARSRLLRSDRSALRSRATLMPLELVDLGRERFEVEDRPDPIFRAHPLQVRRHERERVLGLHLGRLQEPDEFATAS